MATGLDHPHLTTIGLFVEAHAGLNQRLGSHLEATHGLSIQWFEVLIRLARSPGQRLRMSHLAAQTTLSTSGLTRAVDRLEAAGLVSRQACPEDRRVAYATLTEDGRARIEAAVPDHLAEIEALLGPTFDEDDLEVLTGLLRRLRAAANPDAACASEPTPAP